MVRGIIILATLVRHSVLKMNALRSAAFATPSYLYWQFVIAIPYFVVYKTPSKYKFSIVDTLLQHEHLLTINIVKSNVTNIHKKLIWLLFLLIMMSLQTTIVHDGVTNAAERKTVIFSILW